MDGGVFPRGELWPQDRWGRVLNAARNRDNTPAPVWKMVQHGVDLVDKRFGTTLHSMYLSGPAARGRQGGGALLILLKAGVPTPNTKTWRALTEMELQRCHGEMELISISVLPWNAVFCEHGGFSAASFRMGVNSLCVTGPDMSRLIPPQKIDDIVGNPEILLFRSHISHSASRIARARSVNGWRRAAAHAGRAVLAAGFATIMAEEQVYTEDPDLQRDYFSLWRPERRQDIESIYRLAVLSVGDQNEILCVIERTCRWMLPLTESWLNAHNPNRLQSLRA